jgi:hypothetical protein
MTPSLRRAFLALAAATAGPATADDASLRNGFGDPYFRISSAIADCPRAAGPFVTEAEVRTQAHHRSERGTTCWLAGDCERPNSYAYDAGIAAAFRDALARRHPFRDSSLWVTVQGRVVTIEGCVRHARTAGELEAFAKALPNVQQAIAIVQVGSGSRVPYRVMPTR